MELNKLAFGDMKNDVKRVKSWFKNDMPLNRRWNAWRHSISVSNYQEVLEIADDLSMTVEKVVEKALENARFYKHVETLEDDKVLEYLISCSSNDDVRLGNHHCEIVIVKKWVNSMLWMDNGRIGFASGLISVLSVKEEVYEVFEGRNDRRDREECSICMGDKAVCARSMNCNCVCTCMGCYWKLLGEPHKGLGPPCPNCRKEMVRVVYTARQIYFKKGGYYLA